ncbi:Transcription termination factor Rho [Caenorhabditis elegans]|uniref:Transcription termination factor Rho n=1 Tax=Caenorhabditis elegans TaxID=6239 RepID=X5LV58_CAEEL|nr:Transcription termination factor Rho [Caenorhabditis elegans]CDO41095.1 Transcription termination factor Rho [Caenorhabditis elegans]|eukprot:NP_001294042.1 Uncharacterized protein CELE_C28C12.1 [Caenorhabditis elegans]
MINILIGIGILHILPLYVLTMCIKKKTSSKSRLSPNGTPKPASPALSPLDLTPAKKVEEKVIEEKKVENNPKKEEEPVKDGKEVVQDQPKKSSREKDMMLKEKTAIDFSGDDNKKKETMQVSKTKSARNNKQKSDVKESATPGEDDEKEKTKTEGANGKTDEEGTEKKEPTMTESRKEMLREDDTLRDTKSIGKRQKKE